MTIPTGKFGSRGDSLTSGKRYQVPHRLHGSQVAKFHYSPAKCNKYA